MAQRGRKPGQKKKEKKVKVYYPVLVQKPEDKEPKEEITEAELSYNDSILITQIERLAAKGFSNDKIIATLDISRDKFYQRLRDEPYFSYALYKHRDIAVQNVENALYQKCTGFEYTEEQGSAVGIIMEVKKKALPDTNAIKFFLSNRRSEDWKMKVESTQTTGADMSNMTFTIKRRSE